LLSQKEAQDFGVWLIHNVSAFWIGLAPRIGVPVKLHVVELDLVRRDHFWDVFETVA
jgi:hypothetical protein